MAESDDDSTDSISTTSTVASSFKESYPVDDILAERVGENGGTEYLIQWEGYSLDRCTWEPPENFIESEDVTNDETFREWEAKKKLINEGLETPFDIAAWERKQDRLLKETAVRKARRRVKRRRLGKPRQDGSIQESRKRSATSYQGTMKASAGDDSDPRVSKKVKTSVAEDSRNSKVETSALGNSRAAKKVKASTTEDSRTSKKAKTTAPEKKGIARTSTVPSALPTERLPDIVRERKFADTFKPKTKPKASIKSAPSGSSKVSGAAVMENWDKDPTRKKWGLGESWHKNAGGMEKHRFNNMHMKNRFSKHGKMEPQPDVEKLKFVDLKDGKPLTDVTESVGTPKGKQYKSPYQMIQEKLVGETEAKNAREAQAQLVKETEDSEVRESRATVAEESNRKESDESDKRATSNQLPADQEESMFVDPIEEDTGVHMQQEPATETLTGNNSVDTDMQDAPPDRLHVDADETGARPIPGTEDLGLMRRERDVTEHTNKAVEALKSIHLANNPENSSPNHAAESEAPSESSSTTANRGFGSPSELGGPNAPWKQRATNQEMPAPTGWPLHRLTGGAGLKGPDRSRRFEDQSDVYGDLIRKGGTQAAVAFRGLTYNAKGLFLKIKRPPREFNVEMHMLCSEEEYMEKYHDVCSKPLPHEFFSLTPP